MFDGFFSGFVPESTKLSAAVGFLAVTDPDTGANALVTCNCPNPYFDLTSLSLNEYKVRMNQLEIYNKDHPKLFLYFSQKSKLVVNTRFVFFCNT